jgi:RES domain-containing protein
VPVAPEANVAVKVTRSSFSTGSVTSLTSAAAWPTAAPTGRARSVMTVDSTAPRTDWMGPQTNSARSSRWLPMSERAPEPGPPLYRQLIGPPGSHA